MSLRRLRSGVLVLGVGAGLAAPATTSGARRDLSALAPARQLSTVGTAASIAWSPTGDLFASAQLRSVRVWRTRSWRRLRDLPTRAVVWSVAFDPAGRRLAAASADGFVRVWNVRTGRFVRRLRYAAGGRTALAVAWSPRGDRLAAGGDPGNVLVWDAATGRRVASLTAGGYVVAIAWSPDGGTLAGGGADQQVHLWDPATATELGVLGDGDGSTGDVNGLAWSPDGRLVAAATQDGVVRIWDARGRVVVAALKPYRYFARGVAWNPAGTLLLTGSGDGSARVWSATAHEERTIFQGGRSVWSVAWSPNGRMVALGLSRGVRLFRVRE